MTGVSSTALQPGIFLRPSDSAPAERTPEELALAARDGDVEAFDALVARLQGPLHHFLTVRTGCASEAEELCQDAFLRAWQKLDRYDSRWKFSTWLFTLAKRLAVSRARVRRPKALGDEVLGALTDEAEPSAEASLREEGRRAWSVAGTALSTEQRSALWLRYGEDLSIEEIARILGKRRVTARVLLFRAREALAHALDPEAAAARRTTGGRR